MDGPDESTQTRCWGGEGVEGNVSSSRDEQVRKKQERRANIGEGGRRRTTLTVVYNRNTSGMDLVRAGGKKRIWR